MTLVRRDVEASGAAGAVWRSPYPLPLAFLAFTVLRADGGAVNVWWSAPVSVWNAPVTPDKVVAATQTIVAQTDRLGMGTLYVADVAGGSFDVLISGDTDPIASAATAPPLNANALLIKMVAPQSGTVFARSLPLPAGTQALALWQSPIGLGGFNGLGVAGDQSAMQYAQLHATISAWPTRLDVSTALDQSVTITYTDPGHVGGSTLYVIAILSNQLVGVEGASGPLTVGGIGAGTGSASTVGAVAVIPADPGGVHILGGFAAVSGTVLTIPAGRTWFGSVGVALSGAGLAVVASAGAGVIPAAGNLVQVNSPGAVCMPNVYVVAPAGNPVTLQYATSGPVGSGWAQGILL